MKFCVLLVCTAVLMPFCVKAQQAKEVSPYIDLVFCAARPEPWGCARQQSGRILDQWNDQLDSEWQKLKVEADQQVNATLERRGYSSSEPVTKEKPSTILKKIEIGTSYMKDYLKETFDGFLGREYGYEAAQDDEEEKASDELADAEVTRGKKKKKKRAIMKLVLLGTFIKAKIELLLKILGAHLQVKFLAIAVVGLLINIIRFWVDLKRGGAPQKVVYVEHAHHQHHYEDHGDEWSDQSGGYWKRSIETDPAIEDTVGTYQVPAIDPHFLAYRSQVL